ncbi:hypothetical protein AB0G00_10005 [Nocardia salmonicida]|uniref:hypothetical protein n=1 Tax=Nocardia salmonicida TaxID=53431 RepID=UPI0033F61B7B
MTAIIRPFNQKLEDWRYGWLGVFIHAVCGTAFIVCMLTSLCFLWDTMPSWCRILLLISLAILLTDFFGTVGDFRYRLEEYGERCELAEDYWEAMIRAQDELAALRGEESDIQDSNSNAR